MLTGARSAATTDSYYDADGNLRQQIDPDGDISDFAYDAFGNQTQAVAGAGSSDPGTTSNFYDGDGNLTLTVNPVGDSTSYAYDSDGNQTLVISGYGTSAAATVQYVYNANGDVLEEIDPDNNTTSYAYDADGNQTLMIQAYGTSSAATTTYQYDGDGNLIGQGNPNGTSLSMSYDAEGNLISEIWYAGSTVTNSIRYTYDGDGNILTASNDAGTSSFAYNADGEETQAINPNGVTLNYQYDDAGNATQISDSLGDTVTSQYDADGNLIQSSATGPDGAQLAVELSYDGDGNLTSLTRQGQVSGQLQTVGSSSYAYDAQGNVTSIIHTNAAGTTLDSFTYSYDAADELTQEVDYNGTTTAYSYDATGQLVSSGTTAYAYDANGNPSNSGDSVGANNELLTDGTWNYSYDANGNLTGKTGVSGGADAGLTWAYGYDAANELISATETNGQGQTLVQAAYTYDAFGHLLQSSVSTNGGTPVVTEFVYNGDTLWATLNGSGAIQDLYVSGDQPDQYFAQIDASSGVTWFLDDNLGSVRDTMNNSGQLLDTIAYDAYGNILSQSNSSQMPLFGYAGYVYDQSTGLNYANARWYNSQTQQWMEQDPLLLQPGPNTREYVDDEPTNATDPTGEAPLMVPKKGVFDKQIDDVQQQLANADPGSNRAKLLQIQLIYMRHEQAGMAEFVKTRDSLESNQSELVRQKIQVNNQLTEIRKQLNDLNNDLRVLEQRRENQKQRSNALPAGKEKSPEERLKDQIDAAESQITALEEQFASLEASLSDVDTNLKANQNNYTAWRTEKLQNKLQPAFALDTKNGAKSDIHRGIDAKVALDMANRGVAFFRRDPDSKDPNNLIQVPPWGLGGPTASEADEALQKEYQRLKDQEEFPELALNSLQLVLTLGELIPVVGTPIAAVNGTIYAARGMPLEASLSYLAIVPLLGDVTGATKLAKSGLTAASGLLKNTRIARGIASLAKVEPKAVEAAQLAARQRLGLALQSGETTPSAAKQLLQKAGLSPAAAAREVELAEKAVLSLKVLASKSCFVAGTPLLTPEGDKAIEDFREGDLVLSRAEDDADGPLEAKVVETVFVRSASALTIEANGRSIGTTGEHPFYVLGKGWRIARELRAGDWLVSHERIPVRVKSVRETGEVATVYNLRVADYHTYFVGSREWGFSVWAHNANYTIVRLEGGGFTIVNDEGEVIGALVLKKGGVGFDSVKAAEDWAKESLEADHVILKSLDRLVNAPKSLTNIQARDWYNARVSQIDAVEQQMRAAGKTPKEIFETTTQLRNEAKLQARELMQDQALAKSLPPPKTPEEILQKYGGDYEKAIEASKRTNPEVNKAIEELRGKGGQ